MIVVHGGMIPIVSNKRYNSEIFYFLLRDEGCRPGAGAFFCYPPFRPPQIPPPFLNSPLKERFFTTMTTSSSSAASRAPSWANPSSSKSNKRSIPIEDHVGSSSSSDCDDANGGGGGGDPVAVAVVSTLDEPIYETIMRDLRAVATKLRAVLMPLDRSVSFSVVFSYSVVFYLPFLRGIILLSSHHLLFVGVGVGRGVGGRVAGESVSSKIV
jgi:hypothetical protein